jgi:chaperonin cofactor prefoldin
LKQTILQAGTQIRVAEGASETGVYMYGGIDGMGGGFGGDMGHDLEESKKIAREQVKQLETSMRRSRERYRKISEELQAIRRQKSALSARLEAPEPYARKIKPGDILRIEVLEALPGRPLTGERVVRHDGTVGLGFYGDLRVAGLDRKEIKVALINHLRDYVTDESLGLVGQDREGKAVSIPPLKSDRVVVEEVGQSFSPTDYRIDALERKLDRVLSELEAPKARSPQAPASGR